MPPKVDFSWNLIDTPTDSAVTSLSTREAADELTKQGFRYTANEVAELARLRVFPHAKKDDTNRWQIPSSDVELYIKQQKRKRRLRWIKAGSFVAIVTVLMAVISGAKDALDLLQDYVLATATPVATATPAAPLSISKMLFSTSDTHYRVEVTVKNSLSYDVLVTGLSIHATNKIANVHCTMPPAKTYEFSDTFTISSMGESELQFQGFVIDATQQEYRYPVKGSLYDNLCDLRELTLEFDASFVLPAKQFSSFYLVFPSELKLTESPSTEPLKIVSFYQDSDGNRIRYPNYGKLALDIHTDQVRDVSASFSLRELFSE